MLTIVAKREKMKQCLESRAKNTLDEVGIKEPWLLAPKRRCRLRVSFFNLFTALAVLYHKAFVLIRHSEIGRAHV